MNKAADILFSILLLGLAAVTPPALAQDTYPSSPIRLVLGNATGNTVDNVARLLAQKLAAQVSVNVVVDNKPGANGNIGADFVAKAKPDGYTLLLNTSAVILNPAFGEKLSYDAFKDLAPVSLVASAPQLLVAHPSVPANTPAEFITYVRANPNKLAYGSSGIGNITHLGPLLFLQANGLSALHVPYKGASFAAIDLAAGRIQFRFADLISVLPMTRDHRIKVLATAGLKRSPLLPDAPTLSETVMPGFEVGSWFGIMVPAAAPAAIVRRLHGEFVKALQDAETKSRFAQENVEPLGSTPEDYAAYLRSEFERWARLIKSNGIKPE